MHRKSLINIRASAYALSDAICWHNRLLLPLNHSWFIPSNQKCKDNEHQTLINIKTNKTRFHYMSGVLLLFKTSNATNIWVRFGCLYMYRHLQRARSKYLCMSPHNGKHMARKAWWFILFQIFHILILSPTKQFIRISAGYLLSCPLRSKNAKCRAKSE